MADLFSAIPSVVQQTTELVNRFTSTAERITDFLDSASRLKEIFLPPIPKYFDYSTADSLQTRAARFGGRLTSIHIPTPTISEWNSKALLALGVVALVGLGGGIALSASWRLRALAVSALGLFACIGEGGPINSQPPVTNDGGLADLESTDLHPVPRAKNFAYIPSAETGSVLEVNTQTDMPNNFPIAQVAAHTFGVAVTSKRAYFSNGLLYVVDTSVVPKALIARIGSLCQTGGNAGYVAVTPDEKQIYVTCHTFGSSNCNELDIIDAATFRVVATPLMGGVPGKNCSGPLATSPDNHRVYLVNNSLGLVVMDTFSKGMVTSVPGICGEDYEGGVAVTPDSRRVYVTGPKCNAVSVVDTDKDKNEIIATIPVGKRPNGIAITPDVLNDLATPSGYRVYVANTDDNTISVINAATHNMITTIPLNGQEPVGLSLTSDGRRLYVTYYKSSIVTVIDTHTYKIINDLQMAPSWISGKFISPELP